MPRDNEVVASRSAGAEIPEVVIRRLPVYARALGYLEQEGVSVISSRELGDRLQVTPAQIRKDLSYFGEFGKQGTGYHVRHLLNEIRRILGVDREWPVVLVGVGKLGSAIAAYEGFADQGFRVVGAVDHNPEKVGRHVGAITVRPLAELEQIVRETGARMAVVAVPADAAQHIVDQLVRAGVRAILSYAPTAVRVPEHVWIQYSDPVVALQSMTYHLNQLDEARQAEEPLTLRSAGST